MANIAKAMFFAHHLCPLFNCAAFNFNGIPATFAN
jgi:hypothetical protein